MLPTEGLGLDTLSSHVHTPTFSSEPAGNLPMDPPKARAAPPNPFATPFVPQQPPPSQHLNLGDIQVNAAGLRAHFSTASGQNVSLQGVGMVRHAGRPQVPWEVKEGGGHWARKPPSGFEDEGYRSGGSGFGNSEGVGHWSDQSQSSFPSSHTNPSNRLASSVRPEMGAFGFESLVASRPGRAHNCSSFGAGGPQGGEAGFRPLSHLGSSQLWERQQNFASAGSERVETLKKRSLQNKLRLPIPATYGNLEPIEDHSCTSTNSMQYSRKSSSSHLHQFKELAKHLDDDDILSTNQTVPRATPHSHASEPKVQVADKMGVVCSKLALHALQVGDTHAAADILKLTQDIYDSASIALPPNSSRGRSFSEREEAESLWGTNQSTARTGKSPSMKEMVNAADLVEPMPLAAAWESNDQITFKPMPTSPQPPKSSVLPHAFHCDPISLVAKATMARDFNNSTLAMPQAMHKIESNFSASVAVMKQTDISYSSHKGQPQSWVPRAQTTPLSQASLEDTQGLRKLIKMAARRKDAESSQSRLAEIESEVRRHDLDERAGLNPTRPDSCEPAGSVHNSWHRHNTSGSTYNDHDDIEEDESELLGSDFDEDYEFEARQHIKSTPAHGSSFGFQNQLAARSPRAKGKSKNQSFGSLNDSVVEDFDESGQSFNSSLETDQRVSYVPHSAASNSRSRSARHSRNLGRPASPRGFANAEEHHRVRPHKGDEMLYHGTSNSMSVAHYQKYPVANLPATSLGHARKIAAITLQCAIRCRLSRKRMDSALRLTKADEFSAALVLQAKILRKLLQRSRAQRVLTGFFRLVLALRDLRIRRREHGFKQVFSRLSDVTGRGQSVAVCAHDEKENEAATTIQLAVRCRKSRDLLQGKKHCEREREVSRASVTIQCAVRHYWCRHELCTKREGLIQAAAAIRLQNAGRSMLSRRLLGKQKSMGRAFQAAVTVQGNFLMHIARRRLRFQQEYALIRKAEMLMWTMLQTSAATKMQCAIRVRSAKKEHADLLTSHQQHQYEAAITIQAFWKHRMMKRRQSVPHWSVRKHVELPIVQVESCCVAVQSLWRGVMGRRRVQQVRASRQSAQIRQREEYREAVSASQLKRRSFEGSLLEVSHDVSNISSGSSPSKGFELLETSLLEADPESMDPLSPIARFDKPGLEMRDSIGGTGIFSNVQVSRTEQLHEIPRPPIAPVMKLAIPRPVGEVSGTMQEEGSALPDLSDLSSNASAYMQMGADLLIPLPFQESLVNSTDSFASNANDLGIAVEEVSARRLQKVWRGHTSRKAVSDIMRFLASIRLQRAYRGHLGRRIFSAEATLARVRQAKSRVGSSRRVIVESGEK